MNIIFIGMRGSGKTTISKLLAQKLGCSHIETDTLIEKKVGMSISDFVAKNGWEAFRMVESEVIEDISSYNHVVISGGGGVILEEENVKKLKKNGFFVYLTAPPDMLYERIKGETNRPFLTDAQTQREDIEKILKIREKIYRKNAHYIISTETYTREEAVQKVYTYLKEHGLI